MTANHVFPRPEKLQYFPLFSLYLASSGAFPTSRQQRLIPLDVMCGPS